MTDRRPNVVLVVSDDHGYADRGTLGIHPDVHTPGLDRLAATGVSCDSAYVTAPICSPSRAGIISGRNQRRWGVQWFDSATFPPTGATLAERLQDLGYATGYFGKVHYGPEQPGDRACPSRHGFDESLYGLAGLSMGRLHYLHHTPTAAAAYGPEGARRHGVTPLYAGDAKAEYEGFLTAELGSRARNFVGRHAGEPFFCMLAFNAVHNFCWQLPAEELARRGLAEHPDWSENVGDYVDWYDGAISPNLPDGRAYYLAQLELMDAEIGALLDELHARGLAEDTIVVYLTDNGGSTCNYGDNAPLAGTKYTLYEGGIRVPTLYRWPGGGIDGGRQVSGLVSSLDIFPTVLAAAGASPSTYADSDGIDQLALLRGESVAGHERLQWDCGFQWAVRDEEWKLTSVDGESPAARGIVEVEHTDPGNGIRLHRIREDIGEQDNVAAEHPDVVARLRLARDHWLAEVSG